ncbi:MAG: polysaccharide pyruvyl transferase family protein [Lachnospiraceae bacterium]|nr:polysaccharide pyruvyl transferase family protein [Lachnospiraceae bacterium]
MKNVGILTFWGVPNYGGWAQAYALNKVVKETLCDCNAEHIAYLNQHHQDYYFKNDEVLQNSFEYSWDIIPHTDRLDAVSLENKHFNTIVTGSDSIWEFTADSTDDDIHLIGNNLNTDHLVAYAASAGISAKKNAEKSFVTDGLKKYESISVRDLGTKNMVEKLIGIEAPVVLDPSLLYDFASDPIFPDPYFENYIMVYGIIWDDAYIKRLKAYAKNHGFRLISAGYKNDWCDVCLELSELRAVEWVGLVKNASCIAASMFHGLMMGVSMNKRIFFNQHGYVKNRSNTLIKLLDIPYYNSSDGDEAALDKVFEEDIWENKNSAKLSELRKQSLDVLKTMLVG